MKTRDECVSEAKLAVISHSRSWLPTHGAARYKYYVNYVNNIIFPMLCFINKGAHDCLKRRLEF